ncbi:MAG: phosphoglycerate kinase [bacterium]
MRRIKGLGELPHLAGKRVLVRVDYNVPLTRGLVASGDDAKLRASLPTIGHLTERKAKVILVSHLGRPDGHERGLSLAPVASRLEKLLRRKVLFVRPDITADHGAEDVLSKLRDGQVALLENVRFYPGEERNDRFFARRLASLADLYVDDAFAVAHRKHASNVGVTRYLRSYAGSLMEAEVHNLNRLLKRSGSPFVVLLGGAKISTKLPTLKKLLKVADEVLVGGGLANSLLRARGLSVGRSEVPRQEVMAARRLVRSRKIVLPSDVLAASSLSAGARTRVASVDDVRRDEFVLDIGPETTRDFAARIKRARTIVWNGPMGVFEIPQFSHGTMSLARIVAARSSGRAFGVVGGGETIVALEQTGMSDYVDFVSTGGGAMLEYLSGHTLPGIAPLLA